MYCPSVLCTPSISDSKPGNDSSCPINLNLKKKQAHVFICIIYIYIYIYKISNIKTNSAAQDMCMIHACTYPTLLRGQVLQVRPSSLTKAFTGHYHRNPCVEDRKQCKKINKRISSRKLTKNSNMKETYRITLTSYWLGNEKVKYQNRKYQGGME
jgi:hypothetical protein